MKIQVQADCGNSPRKKFLKDFNIAFGRGDVEFLVDHAREDFVWTIVGDRVIEGREAFREALASMTGETATALELQTIITHGRDASASGVLMFGDGRSVAFCDVYAFASMKGNMLKAMTSWAIEVQV